MSDVTYSVVVDISTRGNLASGFGGLAGIQGQAGAAQAAVGRVGAEVQRVSERGHAAGSAMKKLGELGASAAGTVAGAFTGAVEAVGRLAGNAALAGVTAAAGAAAYGVIGLNAELEKTQMSLASIFNANSVTSSIGQGMALAGDMMAKMRKDAAALPGEFTDLVNIFKMVQIPGLRAGGTPERLEKLSADIMAAGAASGLDMHMVAREAGQLMAGRAGAHNILGSQLFGLVGEKATTFNALSGADRLKSLEQQMGKYHDAIGLFEKSFDALSSTLKDNVKKVITESTSPLFSRVKEELGHVNDWFDKNQDRITSWSERMGHRLAYAFDFAKERIVEWTPAIETFAENGVREIERLWQVAEPILGKIEAKAEDFLGDPKAFDKIESVLKLYGAAKVGSSLAGPASKLLGASPLAEAGTAIAVNPLASLAVAVAVAAFGAGAIGILRAQENPSGTFMGATTVDNVASAQASTTDALHNFRGALEQLSEPAGKLADMLAVPMSQGLRSTAFEINILANEAKQFGENLNAVWDAKDPADFLEKWGARVRKRFAEPDDISGADLTPIDRSHVRAARTARGKFEPKSHEGAANITINGGVQITVATNQDPSRVARMVGTEMGYLQRHPKIASGARNFSER